MAATAKSASGKGTKEISVFEVARGSMTCCILGSTPLITEAMSGKVKQGLLLPALRKTAADKLAALKHDPFAEFRDSAYRVADDKAPTRIVMPSTAFKQALRGVAVDIPEVAKAVIGRLTYVEGSWVSVYGVPKLLMSVVRNSDMNRTPDIRTRAILPEWACTITVTFIKPLLRDKVVANLLAAAGLMRGVGGWRTEKGAGDHGQFELVGAKDKGFLDIVKNGGRAVQDKALAQPECYDDESAKLLSWFVSESDRRGFKVAG